MRSPSIINGSRLVASNRDIGRPTRIARRGSRHVVEHVLAVVEHDQGAVRGAPSDDRRLQGFAVLPVGTQRGRDRARHAHAIAQRPQFNKPSSVDRPIGCAGSLSAKRVLPTPPVPKMVTS